MKRFSILLIFTILIPQMSFPCTTFLLSNAKQKLVGKSYDWKYDHGMVMINQRNVAKRSAPISIKDKPAEWLSKYGSVTFNQIGREFPNGGVNEAGLVIEVMWLDETEYPAQDKRPTMNELQWIQYQLDNYRSIAEVLKHARDTRVKGIGSTVHYLACDAGGACSTFEFLKGKLVTHSGSSLLVEVLTNDTYERSVATLKKYKAFGGALTPPSGKKSLPRFIRAASSVRKFNGGSASKKGVKMGFEVLDRVSQGDYTKWNIVYDLKNREIHFRTHQQRSIKKLQLDSLDYSCRKPVKILDLNTTFKGDITRRFVNYSRKVNRKLITQSLGMLPEHLHKQAVDQLNLYPESTVCRKKG